MSFNRFALISVAVVVIVYGSLILSLGYFMQTENLVSAFTSRRIWFSIRLSILCATLAALLAIILALPAAYALSRFQFRGKTAVDTFLEFPMIVSPAALGAMLLIFFNNPAGTWIQENAIRFVFTVAGIVLAQFITILGIAVRLIKTAYDEINPKYEMAARTLGASPFDAFRSVTLRLARRGIIAAFVLSWAKAMGEFGATITVAGTMPMRTETLPVAIFMRLAGADIEGTVALILILITIGLAALYGVRILTREKVYE